LISATSLFQKIKATLMRIKSAAFLPHPIPTNLVNKPLLPRLAEKEKHFFELKASCSTTIKLLAGRFVMHSL